MYFNISSIINYNTVLKEGIVFFVASESRGERSIRCREADDLLIKQQDSSQHLVEIPRKFSMISTVKQQTLPAV